MAFPREFWNRCEVCGELTTRVLADITEPQTTVRILCGLCEAEEQGVPYEPGRFGEGRQLSSDDFDRRECPSCDAAESLWLLRGDQPSPGVVICTECGARHTF